MCILFQWCFQYFKASSHYLFFSYSYVFLTVVPTHPEGPIDVSDITAKSLILHWNPPADDGGCDVSEYIIERCDNIRQDWTNVGCVNGTTLYFEVISLQEHIEYFFRIFAENEVGISSPLETGEAVVAESQFGEILCQYLCFKLS